MERILEDLSTATLIAAIKANLFAWYEYQGRSRVADRRDGPPLTWVLTPVQHPFMNNVLRTTVDAGRPPTRRSPMRWPISAQRT